MARPQMCIRDRGMDACLWLSSAGFAAQFVVLLASPVARLRRQPEAVAG